MRSSRLAAALCVGLAAFAAPMGGGRAESERDLEAGLALRLRARRAEGEQRTRLVKEAVRTLFRVCPRPDGDVHVAACAEAAFRAGELLRAEGDGARAEAAFTRAGKGPRRSPFAMRALLELGHVRRRAEDYDAALDAYLQLIFEARARPVYRDRALLFAGDAWRATGAANDAQRAWRFVAAQGENPLDRVRAYDRIALASLADEGAEAAEDVLSQCLATCQSVSRERTELGESMRRALAHMRVRAALERVTSAR